MIDRSRVGRGGWRWTALAGAMMALGLALNSAAAKESRYDRDIAVYERLLAGAKPGQAYVVCGDYGLTPAQLQVFHDRLVALRDGVQPDFTTPPTLSFLWTGGNVRYRFDQTQSGNGTINAAKKQEFRDGVNEWAAFANLHFVEIAEPPTGNYITVQEDPGRSGGFSSSIGMGGGQQMLLIGPTSWNRGTICHEMGHAIGLYHEQQRDNRDAYVNFFPQNYLPGADGNFTLIPGGTGTQGPYDFYSVMHYERTALSSNGQDTIEPKPAYIQYLNIIGRVGDRILSKLDRAGMAAIYGNPTPLPSATVTNTQDSGTGSLRAAIYYAFDKSTDMPAVPTAIAFHIPTTDGKYNATTGVFTIRPSYEITAPGAGTTIDGATQTAFTGNTNPSGPEIMLDGSVVSASGLGLFAAGVVLRETNCVVRNLIISGFNADGVVFDGGTAAINGVVPSGNVVTGCYIGTDRTGTVGIGNGNGFPGIEFFGGGQGNTIGGTTAALRNLISGNSGHGIQLSGVNGNAIVGNYIGTDVSGASVLSNVFAGVAIFGGSQNNTVGGLTSSARNVISGNNNQGVVVADVGTTGNVIAGNFIGTNPAGTAALPNNWSGIAIFNGAQANTIGGLTSGAGNVISGNGNQGVVLIDAGTNGNKVQGNYIGTNVTGTAALPNAYSGISIFGGAQANVIGGTVPGARNLLSGNTGQGITVSEAATASNLVQGNYIGLDVTGVVVLANQSNGIDIFGGAHGNVIGGTVGGARNFIAGNMGGGVGLSGIGTNSNLVQGNTIGLNTAGAIAANAYQGIAMFQADGGDPSGPQANVIGGSAAGASNQIAGNTFEGVALFDPGTNKNTISRNSIFSNGFAGIGIFTNSNNNIAAPTLGAPTLSTLGNPGGTDVSGSVAGVGTLEFFASPSGDEGKHFVGALSVSAGNFSTSLAAAVPAGYVLTATVTDVNGNTSQFSFPQSVATTDTDGDGIPDNYAAAHMLGANSANQDADGDGLTNLQEFLAGTDPKVATSRLRATAVTRTGADFGFTFASVVGKSYRVEYKNDLAAASWQLLSDQIFANAASTTFNDAGALGLTRRFYRAALEP